MSKPGPSTISQGSLLELKALTAEHADRLAKEGRSAVRGARSSGAADKLAAKERDPFLRPSPGLVKRLALEARNDAKRRVFDSDGGVDDDTRRAIMEAKARKYDALQRGDLSGFSERELAEAAIDYEAKVGDWSDHSSDVDESATVPTFDTLDDMEEVEYVDELGRTRRGTKREAREAERARDKDTRRRGEREDSVEANPYANVRQSHLIHGEQAYFPVYQPDPEALKAKYMEAEREARAHHYDSTKEVRTRGAGAYQFSLDDETRQQQMASLDAERLETEMAREQTAKRGSMSVAQEAKRRRLDARRRVVEAKREQLLGGPQRLARLREERRTKAADNFFAEFDTEVIRNT